MRRLAAILCADVVGYSRLMGTDESGTIAALHALRERVDPLIAGHNGRIFKNTGDGLLAEFSSVLDAIEAATAIQSGVRGADGEPVGRLELRIGIHVGDVIAEGEDRLGDGVNVAARLQELAPAGGICVSATVREQVGEKLPVRFTDLGHRPLKNIAQPVRVFRLTPLADGEKRKIAKSAWPRRLAPIATALVLVLIALAAVWWQAGFLGFGSGIREGTIARPTAIGVLPFANLSGDHAQDYLGDGIAEDLITALSRFRELTVIARNSSFRYRAAAPDLRQIGRELGVAYVLSGSVRRAGDNLRITAQLVDAASGAQRWAQSFDGRFAEIFKVQDEVTSRVTSILVTQIGRATVERMRGRPAESLEAYEMVLKARFAYARFTREGSFEARELLQRATELDRNSASAWAWYSTALMRFFLIAHNLDEYRAPAILDQAAKAASRAVALAPDQSFTNSALATTLTWKGRIDEALALYRKALALNPNDAESLRFYADALSYAGLHRESLEAFRRHERLDPFAPVITVALVARAHYSLRDYKSALPVARTCVERAPQVPLCQVVRAITAAQLGYSEEARAAKDALIRVSPKFTIGGHAFPFKQPADLAHFEDGLRKAGFPE